MDLAGLATLKKHLVEADDFARLWDEFMTKYGERRAFMRHGEPYRSPLLETAITAAAAGVMGREVPVRGMMLIRIPEHGFVHGGLQVGGKFANVFYFEDLGVGLLTVVLSDAGDTRFARFTASTGPGGELARQ
jgi:hypothetical protein